MSWCGFLVVVFFCFFSLSFAKEPSDRLVLSTGKKKITFSFNHLPFQYLATACTLQIAAGPCVALIQQVFGGI